MPALNPLPTAFECEPFWNSKTTTINNLFVFSFVEKTKTKMEIESQCAATKNWRQWYRLWVFLFLCCLLLLLFVFVYSVTGGTGTRADRTLSVYILKVWMKISWTFYRLVHGWSTAHSTASLLSLLLFILVLNLLPVYCLFYCLF